MSRVPGGDFTLEQDAVLRKHYATDGARFCAQRIGKSAKQVIGRANRLGLSAQRNPAERFDHNALTDALGMPRTPPGIPSPSRVTVHRLKGGASW